MGKSIIGFHYAMGGNKQGIGEFMRRLNEKGIPFMMKGTDDAGVCKEGLDVGLKYGVVNWLIYRVSTMGQQDGHDYDAPDYTLAPAEAAQKHWEITVAKWPPELDKAVVWMEPINEPRAKLDEEGQDKQYNNMHPTDWLGWFMLEYAKIANKQGYKVCGPAFNSGEPHVFKTNDYELPGMVAYLRYCAENREKAALAIHEYVWRRWRDNESWDDWYPSLFGRVEAAMIAADNNDIARDFYIFVTEWGFEHRSAPSWHDGEKHITAYNEWAARWPQIKGVATWTLQSGWGSVDNDVQTWIKPLIDYTINRDFDGGKQPAEPHESLFSSGAPGAAAAKAAAAEEAAQVDGAEAAGFEANVDLVNGVYEAGQTFKATWRFKNTGTTRWDKGYRLVYVNNNHAQTASLPRSAFGNGSSYGITEVGGAAEVKPGETLTVTLTMQVPEASGMVSSHWQLAGADGHLFGPLRWMRAKVKAGGKYDYAFVDFKQSVADLAQLKAGERFNCTWTLRNTGTLPLTGDMEAMYVHGTHPETTAFTPYRFGFQGSMSLKALTGQDEIPPGGTFTVTLPFEAPEARGTYAFHWKIQNGLGEQIGDLRWMRATVVSTAAPPPAPPPSSTTKVQYGMNINPNGGHALEVPRMKGLSWSRYVYWASREGWTAEEAFTNRYRSIIRAQAEAGIKSLLIIHQDTYWGSGPWANNGDWGAYAVEFGKQCAAVARACTEFKDMVAYQIHNEVDSGWDNDAGNHNPSAFGIDPKHYALLLREGTKGIKGVDPEGTVVFSGLKTGPANAVGYIKKVEQVLGGQLPMDGLAYHPYGRYVTFDPFYGKRFGTIGDAMATFKQAYPQFPLWISELGVAEDNPLGPEHYQAIGRYMMEVVKEIGDKHQDYVAALIWFAWSDVMRNAGVVTTDGRMKAHIKDAYDEMLRRGN
ncbi:MAG TPA: NBR1-Ig-like domain-containing protein [Anaerolineae bacterium]|nr:NBR1-Ig-like domain-containing protein [Anaerolineae bacterium]